jgi:tRNA(Ile)-lysidine synthase
MKLTLDGFTARLRLRACPPRYWVAYSGGLDSHVLLHLCARLRQRTQNGPAFTAVHVHHGLHPQADHWAAHCERTCRDLQMQFMLLKVDANSKAGESPEEAARSARYRSILSRLSAGEIVLTAQHRDDQAETLLLQLMRGAGLAGLAAMPECAELGPGFLMRPLLHHSRQELHAYAQEHGLKWVEDPSNRDLGYDRNFLRHRVVPLLEQRWPGVKKALGRTAGHCAEAQRLLEDLSTDLCRSVLRPDGIALSVERLKALREPDQRLVLRSWLRGAGYRMPPAAVLERILREVLPAAPDKMPSVTWREGEVRRYRDGLFALRPRPPLDAGAVIPWDGSSRLELPDDNGTLHLSTAIEAGIDPKRWGRDPITVRYRRGGETCRLKGRAGTHTLKKLFQEAGIPPWLRERAPLVYVGEELAVVAGWWVCAPFATGPGESGIAIRWRHSDETCASGVPPPQSRTGQGES